MDYSFVTIPECDFNVAFQILGIESATSLHFSSATASSLVNSRSTSPSPSHTTQPLAHSTTGGLSLVSHTRNQNDYWHHVSLSFQLFANNKPLLPLSVRTAYTPFPEWNSWIALPVKYKNLPLNSQLCITVWKPISKKTAAQLDIPAHATPYLQRGHMIPVAGTAIGLFDSSTLRKGRHRLCLWPFVDADGSVDTTTPSKHPEPNSLLEKEINRIDKLLRKYERGDMNHVDWLDSLLFQEIERLMKTSALQSKQNYLFIELPQFDFPIVFHEKESLLSDPAYNYDVISNTGKSTSTSYPQNESLPLSPSASSTTSSQSAQLALQPANANSMTNSDILPSLVVVRDWELFRDNPVENKHRKLARSHRNGPLDRDLKPNAKIRDELNKIIKYPPTEALSPEEKDLLWKFRFYLTREKKALTKFLKSVCWTDPIEVKQSVELLNSWVDVDVEDALELIGMGFENASVRRFGVDVLKRADDDELLLYLLQLVQALKFEVLLNAALEKKDLTPTSRSPQRPTHRKLSLNTVTKNMAETSMEDSPLTEFLLERAIKNPVLGNNFHWYLMVECEDKNKLIGRMYARVAFQFMSAMMEVPDGVHRRDMLRRQGELIDVLNRISKHIRGMKDSVAKKVEYLQSAIADPKNGLVSFPPMPLPLDPGVHVTGMVPEKATVFKSSLSPLRLTFTCLDGSEYMLIFKVGDDLRQDQLVVQIITLMDRLLRKENLDLKLTPYKVLATGTSHGMVQYVPALPLASILSENNNSLMQYLRLVNANTNPNSILSPASLSSASSGTLYGPGAEDSLPMGVPGHVMDTYLKSCAGYCVITYLLGVGDRHLDNLLLTKTGHLFHVDFGFILGRDPKPFPPPMKLCKEMVEAMGGSLSPHHARFKNYCFVAFNSLRKNANLILNLFALMVHANVPDIALEPDKAVLKVQEKFRLDLTEEEAIQHFQSLINDSVGALFPQVMEKIHSWAQYWRK